MNDNIISKFIVNQELNIDKESWTQLNKDYDKETIKKAIIDEIIADNIKLPLDNITINDARKSFINLCYHKSKDFIYDKTITRYDYKYDISHKFIDEGNVGNDASNYFQQYNRFCASGHGELPPIEIWENAHQLNSVLKAFWTLKMDKIDMGSFRTAISLRKYIASQFKPAVAKSIYEKFNSVDVLDFSSGWGDRLCGFYATKNTKSYIGIDPNTSVYENYYKQIDLYKSIVGEKKVTLYNSCAEDLNLGENIVDTVFTSPPYFNAEMYTNSDNQSYKRYSKIDIWLNGFMYPTLDMVWKALKQNGYLIVNISDVHRNGLQKICDPMNDYIKEQLGGKYIECFGMRMGQRPCSHALDNKEGIFIEPVWVWKKC